MTAVTAVPAAAEDLDIGRLRIVAPQAGAAPAGATSRLRMRIVNGGYDGVHILRMSSPVADEVRMTLDTNGGPARALPSLSVPANEGVDLSTTNLRVVLHGLRRRLKAGEKISLTLHFSGGQRVPVEVNVAGKPGTPAP